MHYRDFFFCWFRNSTYLILVKLISPGQIINLRIYSIINPNILTSASFHLKKNLSSRQQKASKHITAQTPLTHLHTYVVNSIYTFIELPKDLREKRKYIFQNFGRKITDRKLWFLVEVYSR